MVLNEIEGVGFSCVILRVAYDQGAMESAHLS